MSRVCNGGSCDGGSCDGSTLQRLTQLGGYLGNTSPTQIPDFELKAVSSCHFKFYQIHAVFAQTSFEINKTLLLMLKSAERVLNFILVTLSLQIVHRNPRFAFLVPTVIPL